MALTAALALARTTDVQFDVNVVNLIVVFDGRSGPGVRFASVMVRLTVLLLMLFMSWIVSLLGQYHCGFYFIFPPKVPSQFVAATIIFVMLM